MGTVQTQEDNLLLYAIQQGEKSAFDKIFKKYYPMLCAYSNRFVCMEDAEEIVQDVMTWLWESHEMIEIESSFSSYLFRTVYNRTINRIVRNESQQRAEFRFCEKMRESYLEIDAYQVEELVNHIESAVSSLPVSYSEAFTMHRFLGLSYKEIAIKLNISCKTVDYRIQQALKLLRKELIDFLPLLYLLSCSLVDL